MARFGPIRLSLPGTNLIAAPLRMAATSTRMAVGVSGSLAALAVEAVGGAPARRYSANADRCWVEVRGLAVKTGRPSAEKS